MQYRFDFKAIALRQDKQSPYGMHPHTTKNIKVIMSDNNPKIYVLEWDKQPGSEEYDLKVTPHDNPQTALEQAQSSTANQHCISTVNPITGEGEEKK